MKTITSIKSRISSVLNFPLMIGIVLMTLVLSTIAHCSQGDIQHIPIAEQTYNLTREQHEGFLRYLETREQAKQDVRKASLYAMDKGVDFLEITNRILACHYCLKHPKIKQEILSTGRRFFIFKYPSDDLSIIGFLSYVPKAQSPKSIFLIRGGNRSFSLLHPGREDYIKGDHTYIGTTLRGGINFGRDEFGGKDVNDVINLVKFIPTLQSKIEGTLQTNDIYLIGLSRGAMEMILALNRSKWLQGKVRKAVSVVGMLDLEEWIKTRPSVLSKFKRNFLLNRYNKETWLKARNPMKNIDKIRKDLPILIIQGGKDIRVNPALGKNMFKKLKSLGHNVTYWENKDKGHEFQGVDAALEEWLELKISGPVAKNKMR